MQRSQRMFTEPSLRKHAHTANFRGRDYDNFQLNVFDYFHIFAQNIDCGYTLEPPQ